MILILIINFVLPLQKWIKAEKKKIIFLKHQFDRLHSLSLRSWSFILYVAFFFPKHLIFPLHFEMSTWTFYDCVRLPVVRNTGFLYQTKSYTYATSVGKKRNWIIFNLLSEIKYQLWQLVVGYHVYICTLLPTEFRLFASFYRFFPWILYQSFSFSFLSHSRVNLALRQLPESL